MTRDRIAPDGDEEANREPSPSPTAQAAPFVECLGRDLAMRFLIEFGGAELSYALAPRGQGRLEALTGRERAAALARHPRLPSRVPLANGWLARSLRHDGMAVAQIARTLRISDVSVRRHLRSARPTS